MNNGLRPFQQLYIVFLKTTFWLYNIYLTHAQLVIIFAYFLVNFRSPITAVTSKRAGMGKTLKVVSLSSKCDVYIKVPVTDVMPKETAIADTILEKTLNLGKEKKVLIHLDISHEVKNTYYYKSMHIFHFNIIDNCPNRVLGVILLPRVGQVETQFSCLENVWTIRKPWLWTWDQCTTFSKSCFMYARKMKSRMTNFVLFSVIYWIILIIHPLYLYVQNNSMCMCK